MTALQFRRFMLGCALLSLPLMVYAGESAVFYLDLSGHVVRANVDGSDAKSIVKASGGGPDGIAIDEQNGHVYWTNMGKVSENDGFILRADLDGSNLKTIVPVAGTFTPKQIKIDTQNKKLYWSDREGMRVMRSNLDGSQIETLVITGTDADRKDQSRWCVGIAIDVQGGKIYWTQKGGDNANQGTIKRANLAMPAGMDASNRNDVEILFANLPEPIDIDLDLTKQQMYWTDRGDNTISRAPMDNKAQTDPSKRTDKKVLVTGLHEVIGISLDLKNQRMFYTSLTGELGVAKMNGKSPKILSKDKGRYTGIAYYPGAR